MNEVILTIQEKDVTLSLRKADGNVTQKKWIDKNDLLEVFFENLTELHVDSEISKHEITQYNIDVEHAAGYTTQRIARTIVSALNYTSQKHT